MVDYHDYDGNVVSLDKLCRIEPAWAANQIRVGLERIRELEGELANRQIGPVIWQYDEDGHIEAAGTLADYLRENAEDEQLCRDLEALETGQEIWAGGGAAPLTRLVRVS